MGLPQKLHALADYGGVAGIRVTRDAAVLGVTATYDLFDVIGGRVYVTALFGIVVAELETAATTIVLQVRPAAGGGLAAPVVLCGGAALNVSSDDPGTIYSLPDDSGTNPMLTDFVTPNAIDIKELHKNLTEGITSLEDRIAALHNYVASQIRYT
ncbi:unnamed protein product, partial [marine sediment metagenome]